MVPVWDNISYTQDSTGGYWSQGTNTEHKILWNVFHEAIDARISRRETAYESCEVVFIPGGVSLMHAVEGPVSSIITSDKSIYISSDVNIVGHLLQEDRLLVHTFSPSQQRNKVL
jgi:hypothetical protein